MKFREPRPRIYVRKDFSGLEGVEHRFAEVIGYPGGCPAKLLSFECSVTLVVIGAGNVAAFYTPEFQITSDTTVMFQMNFMEGGLLVNSSTNGLSSFSNAGGAIAIDLGPWMTAAYTSNAGIPTLVDALSTRLCGGPLSSSARTRVHAVEVRLTRQLCTQ